MASPRRRKSSTRKLLLGLAALSAGACAPPVPRSPPPPEWGTPARAPEAAPTQSARDLETPPGAPYTLPPGYPAQPPGGAQGAGPAPSELPLDAQLALASLPNVVPYSPGDPVLPGYRIEERIRRGWIIAGGIVFAVAYAGAAGNATSMGDGNGWAPVLGPLFLAGHQDAYGGGPDVLFIVLMALDAAAQATGLGLGIAGVLTHTQVQVRDRKATPRPTLRFGAGGATLVF